VNQRVRVTLVVGAAGLAATAVAAAAIGFGGGPPATTAATGPTLSTAPVTRTTLTQTQQVNGTLDYGAPVTVNGRGDGVITWLPAPGAVIRRGQPVYKTDNRPVSLFYGKLPLYRQLHVGDTGDDVKQIEQNLAALGYTGLTVDKNYTAATASAVRTWQTRAGLPRTGVFCRADVVLAAAPLRIASVTAHLGDPANGPTLTYTGTTRLVRIALDVALQSLVKRGVTATVTLPDGQTVDGTVAAVGSVATGGSEPTGSGATSGASGGTATAGPATIEVIVTVADQSVLGTLDQAPVAVKLVSGSVQNVLTVPVAALVALAEGGYGVQMVTGSTSRYVTVQLGMFADGRVQITGEGITEGSPVGVPS
jgi:peptidoglycan hydrolase-like protein with peptidoglycan-binding domain